MRIKSVSKTLWFGQYIRIVETQNFQDEYAKLEIELGTGTNEETLYRLSADNLRLSLFRVRFRASHIHPENSAFRQSEYTDQTTKFCLQILFS